MGVGRPAEAPTSNCHGEIGSLADAIPMKSRVIVVKMRRRSNMSVIIVIYIPFFSKKIVIFMNKQVQCGLWERRTINKEVI
jgi:hypothetical protein